MKYILAIALLGAMPAALWASLPRAKPTPKYQTIVHGEAMADPNALPIKPVRVIPITRFTERFGAAMPVAPPQEQPPQEQGPPLPVAPPQVPAVLPIPPDSPLRPRHERRYAANGNHGICAKHGMRKVVTRGGKSWRCRK